MVKPPEDGANQFAGQFFDSGQAMPVPERKEKLVADAHIAP
jgi:hypothetical protein